MTPLIISLVALSALMHAARDFFTKSSGDKLAFLWVFVLCGLVLVSPAFLYSISIHGLPGPEQLQMIGISGVVHTIYAFFLMKAYEKGDLSHVYPIARSSPAIILILAVTLYGEQVSTKGVVGILLIVIGAYCINMKSWWLGEILEPIRSIRDNVSTRWAILTMLSIATYSMIDKKFIDHVPPLTFQYGIDIVIFILFSIYICLSNRWSSVSVEWKERKLSAAINGVIAFVGYQLILIAFQMGNLSYIAGLRQLSIVFAVLLGGHLLQEKHQSIRLTCGLLIFAGAFLISIA